MLIFAVTEFSCMQPTYVPPCRIIRKIKYENVFISQKMIYGQDSQRMRVYNY